MLRDYEQEISIEIRWDLKDVWKSRSHVHLVSGPGEYAVGVFIGLKVCERSKSTRATLHTQLRFVVSKFEGSMNELVSKEIQQSMPIDCRAYSVIEAVGGVQGDSRDRVSSRYSCSLGEGVAKYCCKGRTREIVGAWVRSCYHSLLIIVF
jgi:hypothetical protein